IFNNDVLIVDRSVKPANGKIIIAVVDGEMLVRRYSKTMNRLLLLPENKKFKEIEIGEFTTCQVWGTVTCVIHILENSLRVFLNNSPRPEGRGNS
ncbi:MAG: S24 family peptidase, partial [Ferruginibacter sp.]